MILILRTTFLFVLVWSGQLLAQIEQQKQFEKANQLYQSKSYFDAITEYKRLLFFNSLGDLQFEANYQIGLCYKAGAKFDEAIKHFSVAEKNTDSTDEIFLCKTEIIRCNILRKTTDRAIQLCKELENDSRFVSKIAEINYWCGWAYMIADDWDDASKSFALIDKQNELKLLCNRVSNDKVSVTFAKVISYILPGAGQFYSGEFLSGIMSLAWNVFAGYLTVNAFVADRAFDGVVTAELLWLRFYRGNVQNAEKFAEEKNTKIANQALKYLQNEYKGNKP